MISSIGGNSSLQMINALQAFKGTSNVSKPEQRPSIADIDVSSGINLKDYFDDILKDLNIKEPIEDGKSFAENALIKAMNGFTASGGIPTLADDSGFCIDNFNDFPGLYSARFAEACGGYEKAFEVINKCLLCEFDFRIFFK